MGITSIDYFIFLIISLIIYYLIPLKYRWLCLVAYSAFFFLNESNLWTGLFLLICIVITYIITLIMSGDREDKKKYLKLGLIVNIVMLIIFKYSNFFIDNLNVSAEYLGITLGIPRIEFDAPLGISFYSFTAMGYILDCYWGTSKNDKYLPHTALFIGYYPQLVSGPITRRNQVDFENKSISFKNLYFGTLRILWGIFKKIVISSRLKMIVDAIYSDINNYTGLYIWVAAALFVFELYTDFSGCMDIVLGTSECYGIILPENFRQPLFATTVQEFWQRWHITLGAWFREFILFPVMNTNFIVGIENYYKKKYS